MNIFFLYKVQSVCVFNLNLGYKHEIDELYNLIRARPHPYAQPQIRNHTSQSVPAITDGKMGEYLDREAKRNEKLEREIQMMSKEYSNEKNSLMREIHALKYVNFNQQK